REVLTHSMVGDARVLRDGGDIEAPPALLTEPGSISIGCYPVHGEGRGGPVPGDTATVALAKTGGLAERHPAPLREAAMILRHGQAIAVLERHLVDGPNAALPHVHQLRMADLPGRFVTHPETHTAQAVTHRHSRQVAPRRVRVPGAPTHEQARMRRRDRGDPPCLEHTEADQIAKVLLPSIDQPRELADALRAEPVADARRLHDRGVAPHVVHEVDEPVIEAGNLPPDPLLRLGSGEAPIRIVQFTLLGHLRPPRWRPSLYRCFLACKCT